MTSPSAMFKRLGAPLHNVQWSWGAVRADGSVFLRVWQDETRKTEDGRRFIRLVNHRAYAMKVQILISVTRNGSPIWICCVPAEPDM